MRIDPLVSRPGGSGLAGRRILVPRGGTAGERWAAAIRERGGDPVVVALTETAPPEDPAALARAAERWNRGAYDWLAVTSANGAHAIADAGAGPRASAVAAVGPATADALRERGFAVTLQPERDFSAAGLAEALIDRIGAAAAGPGEGGADPANGSSAGARRLLLPLSEIASGELERALAEAGHLPERVTAYRTVPAARDAVREAGIAAGEVDAILVLSGSGAVEVAQRFGPPCTGALPGGALLAAIGEPTARALADHGLRADVVATRHTVDGLLEALSARLADPEGPSSAVGRARPADAAAVSAAAAPAAAAPAAAPDPACADSVAADPAADSALTGLAVTDPARSGGTPA